MEELRLDLSRDATRQTLQGTLESLLPEGDRERVEADVAQLRASGRHFHDLGEITECIAQSGFSEEVRWHALAIYQVLAEAEAAVHGCAVDETHFHEVGNAEAVANVLAICLSLEALGYPRVVASAVQAGKGKVQCAHGLLDIPAPATAAIIARGIPLQEDRREGEWCTPTSAAVIYHFVDEFEV